MPVSNGLEIYPNFYELNCADPLPVGQACRLLDSPERSPFWSCRFDRITNHESLLTNHPSTRSPALGGPLTFHILPSALTAHHQSPITNHQSLLTAALAAFVRLVLGLLSFPLQDQPWPSDSRVNLKTLFEILTDKEIEELQKRAIRQRNIYAANLLRWEADERSLPKAKPVQSPFVRCKDARVMMGGRSILERCEGAGWLTPVSRGKRLTLFKRDDIEAAQLVSRGANCPELALFSGVV
jgi:hypothetical protein